VVPRETNGHLLCEQHLFGNPAKVPEGALDTGKPTLPALVVATPDIKPPANSPVSLRTGTPELDPENGTVG